MKRPGRIAALLIRPIDTDKDVALATALLVEGFPAKPASIWPAFFERLRILGTNGPAGVPFGYLMNSGEKPTGVMMTPAMLRTRSDGAQGPVINLSSWYVQPPERWRAGRMLQAVMKQHDAMFTDLTPTDEVRAMLPAFGFVSINAGVVVTILPVAAAWPAGGARVREMMPGEATIPDDTRRMLEAHVAAGCLALVQDGDGPPMPLLLRKRRLKGLPAAKLIYCPDLSRFQAAMPVLARALVAKRVGILMSDDTQAPLRAGQLKRRRGLKFIRPGAGFAPVPNVTDHTASELALLDL